MRWFYGPKIEHVYDTGGFQSHPVRLNIDEVDEIASTMKEAGMANVRIEGKPYGVDVKYRPVPDLATANLIDIGDLNIWGERESGELPPGTSTTILVEINPDRVTLHPGAITSDTEALVQAASARIRRILDNTSPGPLSPSRKADLITWTLHTVVGLILIGSWIWLIRESESIPGVILAGAIVLASMKVWRVQPRRLAEWFQKRPGRWWLDQKSRTEVISARSDGLIAATRT